MTYIGAAENHRTGLHQRQVAGLYTVDHQLGEAGIGKDGFDDHHTADQIGQVQGDNVDDRADGIEKRVTQDNASAAARL